MIAMVVITAIVAAAVAFLVFFFVQLCRERNRRTCHVVHVSRMPVEWDIEIDTPSPIGIGHSIPRRKQGAKKVIASRVCSQN
jgi:hypothetical protein